MCVKYANIISVDTFTIEQNELHALFSYESTFKSISAAQHTHHPVGTDTIHFLKWEHALKVLQIMFSAKITLWMGCQTITGCAHVHALSHTNGQFRRLPACFGRWEGTCTDTGIT